MAIVNLVVQSAATSSPDERARYVEELQRIADGEVSRDTAATAADAMDVVKRLPRRPKRLDKLRVVVIRPWHLYAAAAGIAVAIPFSLVSVASVILSLWHYLVSDLWRTAVQPLLAQSVRSAFWVFCAACLAPGLAGLYASLRLTRDRKLRFDPAMGSIWVWQDKQFAHGIQQRIHLIDAELKARRGPPKGFERGSPLRYSLKFFGVIFASLLAIAAVVIGFIILEASWQRNANTISEMTRTIETGSLTGRHLADAHFCRAFAWERTRQDELARNDLDRALKADSTHLAALLARASLSAKEWRRGSPYANRSEALSASFQDLSRAIELDPTLFAARYNRALLRLSKMDRMGAEADFKAAEEILLSATSASSGWTISRARHRFDQARTKPLRRLHVAPQLPASCPLARRPDDPIFGFFWWIGEWLDG
ncbi:MAG TPA: hypothetical protein PK264_13445 [Hyphomicrobiaceae bacterium]|nr:hypothetical protein [Hyphomicrobiaceae bacterium]